MSCISFYQTTSISFDKLFDLNLRISDKYWILKHCFMNIGSKITQLRKQNNWSQEELAQHVESSRIMIGKYERAENLPSVDVLVRLAKAFNVSVDYLIGEGANASYDKDMIKRLEEVENLPSKEKDRIFHYIDLIIRDYKAKAAYA